MKKLELDVDFIGGQGSLTSEEEKAVSEFLKKRKLVSKKPAKSHPLKTIKRHSKTSEKI